MREGKRTLKRLLLALVLTLSLGGLWGGSVRAASVSKTLNTQAASIVKKKVKDKDTKKTKLKKLFAYAEKTWGYKRVVGFKPASGWEKTYAVELYKTKKGSCYHFAAGYAFLAKKATGYPVRVAVGKTNGFNKNRTQPHAWAEVKIGSRWYVCDANLDKFGADSSGKYFLKERSKLKSTYNNYKGVKYVTVKF